MGEPTLQLQEGMLKSVQGLPLSMGWPPWLQGILAVKSVNTATGVKESSAVTHVARVNSFPPSKYYHEDAKQKPDVNSSSTVVMAGANKCGDNENGSDNDNGHKSIT